MNDSLQPRAHGEFLSRGLRLHYVEWGAPDRPLMIMLHGGLEHCRSMDWLALHFSASYRVVCLDLRGHGDSDHCIGGGYTVPDSVADLRGLYRHLEATQATIIAHSYGANVALYFAALFPTQVKALVAIEGLSPASWMEPNKPVVQVEARLNEWLDCLDKAAMPPRVYATINDAIARVMQNDPLLPTEIAEHVTRFGLKPGADGGFVWKYDPYMRSLFPATPSEAEWHRLWGLVACPTLLMCGELSWASNPALDGRQQYFSDARVVNIPGAGHNLHHHRPEPVEQAISAFLADR